MTDTRTFVAEFRRITAAAHRRPLLPNEVLDAWRDLVDECESGYGDNIYEYDNDLYIRDLIERLLTSPSLGRHDELDWFRAEVHATDARFRALLCTEPLPRSEGKPWWHAYAPRFAGAELAMDLHALYGTNVEQT